MAQNPTITKEEAERLKQDMRDGTVESPTIKFMENQTDADGNKVLGAFNKDTNEILIDKALFDQAQAGDQAAAATLLGVMAEEQGHAVASVLEQRMGIQDFRFDEGGLAARSILQDFASSGSQVTFDLNIGGSVAGFSTSADAINNELASHFTSSRLLNDYQMGGNEFSTTNAAGTKVTIESGDTLGKIVKAELGADATAGSIAARIQEYKAANEGLDPNKIRVGQELNIPGAVGTNEIANGDFGSIRALTDTEAFFAFNPVGQFVDSVGQGISNVSSEMVDLGVTAADTLLGTGLYVGDAALTAGVDIATLVTDPDAIWDLDARTDEVIANGYLPKGEELAYRMANEIYNRGLDDFSLRVDGRVIGDVLDRFATPFPLDSTKVHGSVSVNSDNNRIFDGKYDFLEANGTLNQIAQPGANIVEQGLVHVRNKLNHIAYSQHDSNGKPFEIEYTYTDNDLLYGRRNFAPWHPDVDPDYADPYSVYLQREANR